MKKLFMLLALVLGVVSCQTEPEGFDVVVGGEQDVNITVSLPDETRADSAQGFNLNNLNGYKVRYILEISYNNRVVRDVQTAETTSVVFPVRLAPGRDYQFTVWADLVKEGQNDLYYNVLANAQEGVSALSNITFKTWTPNTEARDAWTDTKSIKFGENPEDLSMTLTRPFAKVRVVATDIKDIRKFGIEPTSAVAEYFTAEMYTEFDAVAGAAKGETTGKTHIFNYDDVDTYEGTNGEQLTLFADYVLVPADGNVQFSLSIYADEQRNDLIKTNNFNTAIPVEANKVTSIVGSVLTEGGNVNITVDSVLGEKETFTYISSGAELLKVIKNQNSGKYILGCNIDVDENDVALAGTLSATRSTTTETVINLNGYTITINNKSNKPLVTVAEGNTLTFAGAGNIVMTSESTAPFVDNNNTNGVVIIEQATLTNNSANATIVDGTAVVNDGVEIEGNVASRETTSQLDYVLANGGEVTLLKDVTSNNILEISATNPVVINGNGKTISFTSNRGFRITASNNVTIENATIVNNVDYGRCIETRTGNINLTLNNVNLTATQTGSQPFTVGGSGIDVTVNINNSTINAGKGYGITTFNPTALTINNSTVTGYAALNIKVASSSEGSAGSVINVTGSTLAGVNNWPGVSNACSTIMVEDSDVTINIDSTSTVEAYATANIQTAINLGNELVDTLIDNCDITIAGTVVLEGKDARYALCSTKQGSTGTNAVKFNAEYAEGLQTEGWIVSEPTDSLVTITSAGAKIGDNGYKTLEEAVAAAKEGDTITIAGDITLTENVTIPAGVIFNGNGKQINGTLVAGGDITFAGHTKVTSFSASYYDRVITIGVGACLEVTGTGRVSLAYGNTFNITGSIEDAKTADKAEIKPSLIIPAGISITGGNDATMNVTNAYVQIGSTTSKPGAAGGIFTFKFDNSIAEFTKEFGFYAPTGGMDPTFVMNIEDSVFTTGTKLCVAAANSTITVDNSTVTLGTYLRNSGTIELTNGSVLTGKTIQFGENGGNDGTINVDNSSFSINCGNSTDYAFDGKGTGSITAKEGATVAVQYYKDMTINVDATSTFTGTDIYGNRKIHYVSEEMKLEPTNPDALGGATIVSNVWDKTTGKGVITFDRDLTTIGDKAFQRVTNTTPSNWATSITLPASVKSIGEYAFAQCYSLTTITIPDGVTTIGQYAFQSCDAVTTVTIGSRVSTIGSGAFYNCYEIKEFNCKSATPPALADKGVFNGVDKIATVYVPATSVEAYKAAWSMFADKVVAGEF